MAETSNARLRRLLTLVPWLAAHSGISKADAASHFGVTVSQLESDLELVTVTGPGLYGGELVDIYFEDETITVYDAQGLLEPVHLTGDESAALILGLQALQQLPDDDAIIATGLLQKLGESESTGLLVSPTPSPFSVEIASALEAKQDLLITYAHPVRDDITVRTVTPWRVVTRDGFAYLHGYCHSAEAGRTFRLDRITECAAVPAVRPTADAPQPSSALREAIVEVLPAFESILERVPHAVLSRNATITAAIQYGDDEWLIQWLIECGAAVHCQTPQPIAAEVARRADSARNLYRLLH